MEKYYFCFDEEKKELIKSNKEKGVIVSLGINEYSAKANTKKEISGVNFANTISEKIFDMFYVKLRNKATAENNIMYQRDLNEHNKKKKKKMLSGKYESESQRLFNAWLSGDIAHCFVVSMLDELSQKNDLVYGITETLKEETKKLIEKEYNKKVPTLTNKCIIEL